MPPEPMRAVADEAAEGSDDELGSAVFQGRWARVVLLLGLIGGMVGIGLLVDDALRAEALCEGLSAWACYEQGTGKPYPFRP